MVVEAAVEKAKKQKFYYLSKARPIPGGLFSRLRGQGIDVELVGVCAATAGGPYFGEVIRTDQWIPHDLVEEYELTDCQVLDMVANMIEAAGGYWDTPTRILFVGPEHSPATDRLTWWLWAWEPAGLVVKPPLADRELARSQSAAIVRAMEHLGEMKTGLPGAVQWRRLVKWHEGVGEDG